MAQEFFHRSHSFAFAGNDQIEETEIGVDIQGEAVRGYPARDVYADGGDFAARRMHAREPLDAKGFDAKITQGADQDFFEVADVTMHVLPVRAQIDDRVADDLAQPVIRDFAAAVGFKDRYATSVEDFGWRNDSGGRRATPERQHMRMLEQKQRVGLRACQNSALGLFLQVKRGAVFHAAEPLDLKGSPLHDFRGRIILAAGGPASYLKLTSGGVSNMKSILTLAIAVLLFLPSAALSQTRSRTTAARPSASKRGARASKPRKAAEEKADAARAEGATRVAFQIKTLTKFLYVLGGVAKGIEQMDEAAQRNEASPAVIEQNRKNKATVRTSLQDVRVGLDQLEVYFRTTPELEGFYLKLAGVASGAATAEEQAAANQFNQAGITLLGVVNRLADVLVEMR